MPFMEGVDPNNPLGLQIIRDFCSKPLLWRQTTSGQARAEIMVLIIVKDNQLIAASGNKVTCTLDPDSLMPRLRPFAWRV